MLRNKWDGYFQVSPDFRQAVCNNEQALDCEGEQFFKLLRKMSF